MFFNMGGGGEWLRIFPSLRAQEEARAWNFPKFQGLYYEGEKSEFFQVLKCQIQYIDIFLHISSYFLHIPSHFPHILTYFRHFFIFLLIPSYFDIFLHIYYIKKFPNVTSSGGLARGLYSQILISPSGVKKMKHVKKDQMVES